MKKELKRLEEPQINRGRVFPSCSQNSDYAGKGVPLISVVDRVLSDKDTQWADRFFVFFDLEPAPEESMVKSTRSGGFYKMDGKVELYVNFAMVLSEAYHLKAKLIPCEAVT